jgi:hypothetical protein
MSAVVIILGATFGVFLLAVVAMAVGTLLQGRCLRGSCGGESAFGPDGELLVCPTCPRRKELEEEAALRAAKRSASQTSDSEDGRVAARR